MLGNKTKDIVDVVCIGINVFVAFVIMIYGLPKILFFLPICSVILHGMGLISRRYIQDFELELERVKRQIRKSKFRGR